MIVAAKYRIFTMALDMKSARQKLGLSLSEFAALHQVSELAARRWEYPIGSSGRREPSGSAKAFTQALLDGYRPRPAR